MFQGSEWDEVGFEEAVRRVVADVTHRSWIPPINLRNNFVTTAWLDMLSRNSMFSVSVSFRVSVLYFYFEIYTQITKNKILKERGCWCYSHHFVANASLISSKSFNYSIDRKYHSSIWVYFFITCSFHFSLYQFVCLTIIFKLYNDNNIIFISF